MPVKAKVLMRRWFHHRTRSEYRELTETDDNVFSDKIRDWVTVPGLIMEDEALLSVEDNNIDTTSPREKEAGISKPSLIMKQPIADMHGVVQRLSKSQSFETLETEEESDLAEIDQSPKRHKSIRWADDEGKTLVVRHEVEILAPLNVRIVVLMLNPAERIFEFVQCEFQTDERLTVSDLLVQLPFMASMESLKKQRYIALYRGEREMVNIISIQDYDIVEGEILVAVASTANPKQAVAAASALLMQRSLTRAVQKAKLSGRALQKLMSSADLAAVLEGAGPPDATKSGFDEDEESRDDCRLVLRVLNRELEGHSHEICERQMSSDDDEDDEEMGEDADQSAVFSFVAVPELRDEDFLLFQEAIIDPYSPIARGRMNSLPQNLLREKINNFNPPFHSYEVDNIMWDEGSSDDEEVNDLQVDPPVQNFQEIEEDEETQSDQILNNSKFPQEVNLTGNHFMGNPMVSALFGKVLRISSTESNLGGRFDGLDDHTSPLHSFEDHSLIQRISEEIGPIPIISDPEEEEDGESSSLPEREVCELSHISEVDTLEENDDATSNMTLSQHESDDESVDAVSNIPEIESSGDEFDTFAGWSKLHSSTSHEEKALKDAYAFYAATFLLVGSVSKVSSPHPTRSPFPQPVVELQEAEV